MTAAAVQIHIVIISEPGIILALLQNSLSFYVFHNLQISAEIFFQHRMVNPVLATPV
jgi:hypothetical protein